MVAKRLHLVKLKSGIFEYRRRVPEDPRGLPKLLKTSVWKLSTGTRDPFEAAAFSQRLSEEVAEIKRVAARLMADGVAEWPYRALGRGFWDDVRKGDSPRLDVSEGVFLSALVDNMRQEANRFIRLILAEPVITGADAAKRVSYLHRPYGTTGRSVSALFKADLASAEAGFTVTVEGQAVVPSFTHSQMMEAVTASGVKIDAESLHFAKWWRRFAQIQRRMIEELEAFATDPDSDTASLAAFVNDAAEIYVSRTKLIVAPPMRPPEASPMAFPAVAVPALPAKSAAPLFSTVRDAYFASMERGGNWRPATRADEVASLEMLRVMIGDKPITDYTKNDAREFQRLVSSLPKHFDKQETFKGMTVLEIANTAVLTLENTPHAKTVNKRVTAAKRLFSWLADRYSDHVTVNPFERVILKVNTLAHEARYPWKMEDLNIVLGLMARERDNGVKSETLFWVFIISLYTGARSGEIIQMKKKDVLRDGVVDYFHVRKTEDDDHLKSVAALRRIPIHHKLIEIGVLDFIKSRAHNDDTRIFDDIDITKKSKSYSNAYASRFGRFCLKHDIKRTRTTTHSLRHNYQDACAHAQVPDNIASILQGHQLPGMKKVYGSGADKYPLTVLNEWVQRIDYPGLDLSQLKP